MGVVFSIIWTSFSFEIFIAKIIDSNQTTDFININNKQFLENNNKKTKFSVDKKKELQTPEPERAGDAEPGSSPSC